MQKLEFLSGGDEMGELIRNYDWSQTSLGTFDQWPHSLRTCIRIMLTSRQPIWIGWGKDLIKFYNDPYKAIVGGKHPWALGKPASKVWKDIWKDIGPMLKQVMEKNEGTYVESQLLIMERNGYPEETYYTFSYTPIPGDDGKTAGMFCANTDDTDKIISERQLKTLTQLGKRLTDCKSNEDVIKKTIETLQENPQDFPFALFRTIQEGKAILQQSTPLGDAKKIFPKVVDLNSDTPIASAINQALESRKLHVFEQLNEVLGNRLPKGAWDISPNRGIVLPLFSSGIKEPYGVLAMGLNPHRLLDEKYTSFFSLVGDQVVTSFADVHALEQERKRAEALAEIDQAKTTFFSNISHEFRTPLTLLLGPIEEVMNDSTTLAQNKTRMDIAYRNALRMQRLVNTLLEFSRIEAGRLEGRFSPVDLCSLTHDLVSNFQSAIEKAGMKLEFRCENLGEDVYVDVEMWEKIVLNLVSNAFKYSKEGTISIDIKKERAMICLSVTDTGIGIPEEQLEKIFDRFHRIENIQGRSQEGSGIGLAMVKELVRLHYGSIDVQSAVGKGSTFRVRIPAGKAHLPEDKIKDASPSLSTHYANAFVQEALKWIPAAETAITEFKEDLALTPEPPRPLENGKRFTVLIADDNADMRQYVKRLLSLQFDVLTAVDGEDAYHKAVRHNPDLVLSDVMMPKLDGFGLLEKIRNHPDRNSLPVILLSARAGEEAKVEGLGAGADDYLVKPFSAKELLARVEGNIRISKSRMAAEENLRNMIRQSPVATTLLRGPSFIIDIVNDKGLELWGRKYEEVLHKPIALALPEIAKQGFSKILEQVYNTGITYRGNETPVELIRFGKPQTFYLNFIYEPQRNEENEITGIIAVAVDVTEQVLSRKKVEQSEKALNELANAVPQLVWTAGPDGEVTYYNNRISEYASNWNQENAPWKWQALLHEQDQKDTEEAWKKAVQNGTTYQIEHRVKMKDGTYRWHLSRAIPYRDDKGNIVKWFGTATDIQATREQTAILEEEVKKRTAELQELNQSLQRSNNELQQFAHVASHDLKEPLRKIKTFTGRLAEDPGNSFTEKSKGFIQKICSASDRMSAMIEGVLNYSLINTSEQKIEPVKIESLLQNIESDLELLIAQKNASLHYESLPQVEGSSVLLYQLFYNLLNNALKFSKSGVPLRVEISASSLEIDGAPGVRIQVSDNGIGFAQQYAEKIFESFTRLNSKDQFEGTGLGLSLCKRIVERHGGHIEATGKPGEGASFSIYLPVRQKRKSI